MICISDLKILISCPFVSLSNMKKRTNSVFICVFVNFLLSDYGVDKYDIGTGFGHFGIAVEDVRIILALFII